MNSSHDQGPIHSSLQSKLARLREMLLLERDLEEISTYFHTVLVPDDEFIMAGRRVRYARLVETLHGVLSTLALGGELRSPLILRIEKERMCHGYASWHQGHALFFYFETLEMGFCSFARSLTSPEVTFSRFRLPGATSPTCWSTTPRGSA